MKPVPLSIQCPMKSPGVLETSYLGKKVLIFLHINTLKPIKDQYTRRHIFLAYGMLKQTPTVFMTYVYHSLHFADDS